MTMQIASGISIGMHRPVQDAAPAPAPPPGPAPQGFTGASPLMGTRQAREPMLSAARYAAQTGGLPRPVAGAAPRGGFFNGLKRLIATATPHYERREMPVDRASLQHVKLYGQLTTYPYHRDMTTLPEGWLPNNRLAGPVAQELGMTTRKGVELRDGAIVDAGSGLTATLLVNNRNKEFVLSLGGTTSGKKVGDTLQQRSQPGKNFMTTLSQWCANFKAGLGGTPKSYQQAADLVQATQRHIAADPLYQGFSLRVVGHSKGGGEAMYAALKVDTPVKATVFCPAHLSQGLIAQLPAGNLARAKELVESYSPYGDPVAAVRGAVPGVHGVGAGYHFDGIPGSNAINLHDQFFRHVAHHCDAGLAP